MTFFVFSPFMLSFCALTSFACFSNELWVSFFLNCKFLCIRDTSSLFLFFKDFMYLFFRERKGERGGEKHQHVVASHAPPTGDLACIPGMCPEWELNQ